MEQVLETHTYVSDYESIRSLSKRIMAFALSHINNKLERVLSIQVSSRRVSRYSRFLIEDNQGNRETCIIFSYCQQQKIITIENRTYRSISSTTKDLTVENQVVTQVIFRWDIIKN